MFAVLGNWNIVGSDGSGARFDRFVLETDTLYRIVERLGRFERPVETTVAINYANLILEGGHADRSTIQVKRSRQN